MNQASLFNTNRLAIVISGLIMFASEMAGAQGISKNGVELINTVTTAVPFQRIVGDARAGGMGDVGIALTPDINGLRQNPAKMAFAEKDFGFGVNFSPWLRQLVTDIYLADVGGYYKVKDKQVIAASLRYFSLGSINFTDENNQDLGTFRPNEFSVDIHYARLLGKYFSLAASLRYIYSNLAAGQTVAGAVVKPGMAGSGDISWYFKKNFKNGQAMNGDLIVGMNISNIGSKISYTDNKIRDYIPTNLGIGFGYKLNFDSKERNSIGVYMDFNKLLVPTPDTLDKNNNNIYDFKEKSSIAGMFTSFGDAPGGAREEFKEITVGIGAEYMYNKLFGVRFGYFYEPRTKGNRQFLTAGLSVKYSVFGLNFAYLIPTTTQRNPLDNTLRFSLLFDFAKGGKKKDESSGISLVPDEPKAKKSKNKVKEDDLKAAPSPTAAPVAEPVKKGDQ